MAIPHLSPYNILNKLILIENKFYSLICAHYLEKMKITIVDYYYHKSNTFSKLCCDEDD